MATLYRGSRRARLNPTPRDRFCFTDLVSVATVYGGYDEENVATYDLPLDELCVVEVAGYDHDENSAPADCPSYVAPEGADVIVYEDEDERGQSHTCWRLVSDRAVSLTRHLGYLVDLDEDDSEDE